MKQVFWVALSVWLAAALGGWMLALHEEPARRLAAEKKENDAKTTALKAPSHYFADLVRASDEAVIVYGYGKEEKRTRITDPAWLERYSSVLLEASYQVLPSGLWVSQPEITFYRNHSEVLSLMASGSVLRIFSVKRSGEFLVGKDTAFALHMLTI